MNRDPELSREDWKHRFQAVGRAQARYLFLLLLSGAFFWMLHIQVSRWPSVAAADQELPVVGVSANRLIVWAAAPLVLGCMLLAVLGTFNALSHASKQLGVPEEGEDAFERFDVSPTAIDLIVYTDSRLLGRLGLFSYPLFLSVIFLEASSIWRGICFWAHDLPGRSAFLVLGAVVLLICVPRLVSLWVSKAKKAFSHGPA